MKVITTPVPEWFFNSKCFILEADSNSVHYKSVKERIEDYSTIPTFTLPSNKIFSSQTKKYSIYKSLEGNSVRTDPSENYGSTHFSSMTGIPLSTPKKYINGYPDSKLISFRDFGGNLNDPPSYNYGANSDKIQWINGESTVGYVIDNESERAAIEAIMNTAKTAQPNSLFSIYSIPAFTIFDKWYDSSSNLTKVNELAAMLTTPIDSVQITAGFNLLMEDLYSTDFNGTDDFPALYILMKQIARKKYQLTGNSAYSKFLSIFWSQNEGKGLKYIWKRKDGFVVRCGEGGSIDGLVKPNAYIDHAYNLALACFTIGDGLVGYEGNDISMLSCTSDNVNGSIIDVEKISTSNIQASLNGDIFLIDAARTWKGSMMFVRLAAYNASMYKSIIEGTTYEWETPDFIYGSNTRTGIYKTVPYNKYYKEPVVEFKYSNDKSECLIYACNFWNTSTTPKLVTVKIADNLGVIRNIPILLKNKKAELIKVIF